MQDLAPRNTEDSTSTGKGSSPTRVSVAMADMREQLREERHSGDGPLTSRQRGRAGAVAIAWVLAAALPLVGLVSLLLRSQLDPHFENYRLHFVLFGLVGAVAFGLGYAAGEAARRRGDARVLLLSLALR